jgi:TonB family protein
MMCSVKRMLVVVAALGMLLGANFAHLEAARPDEKPRRVTVPGKEMSQRLTYKVNPIYPEEAKKNKIQGTVKMTAVVGTDGTIQQLRVDEGYPLLVKAALDAVRQWKYEPMFVNGEPVEVVTAVYVIFQLG